MSYVCSPQVADKNFAKMPFSAPPPSPHIAPAAAAAFVSQTALRSHIHNDNVDSGNDGASLIVVLLSVSLVMVAIYFAIRTIFACIGDDTYIKDDTYHSPKTKWTKHY